MRVTEPTQVDLTSHPFISARNFTSDDTAVRLTRPETVEIISDFLNNLLSDHTANPFDAIIGDDVSGRIPTLVAHRFLRLAHTAGHIPTVPRTFFLAAGHLEDDTPLLKYLSNLENAARVAISSYGLTNVLIVTEVKGSGTSITRMSKAIEYADPNCRSDVVITGGGIWLGGKYGSDRTRGLLGVEKYSPEAVTRRMHDYDAEKGAQLRSFLDDYTDGMYRKVLSEPSPAKALVTRESYSTAYRPPSERHKNEES